MKTPEQIAEKIIADHFYYTKTTAAAISAIIMAIEADRAQREDHIIAQKQWVLDDFKTYWKESYEGDYDLTPEQVEEVIDSAPEYLTRAVLTDCTDAEWDAIGEALELSLKEVVSLP